MTLFTSARIARRHVSGLATATARSKHTLPQLSYEYKDLEPAISGQIMELHHSKHHATYVAGLNAAEENYATALKEQDVRKQINLQAALKFNGGGHVNHTLLWESLKPEKSGGGKLTEGSLYDAVTKQYGSLDELKKKMNAAAAGIQGSGWAWLGVDPTSKSLVITTTPNQDPLLAATPLFGIDMWEHAFYLQHQNRKPNYLQNIWRVINFENATQRFESVH
ncbi:uncharacterized protein L969DRAFT_42281 [Mixia osmundae IAM 14324]|uniref:Superoxide dismutase n=1 Tax=Mixia osmundae (strain CBS 9802 / IAM 14324 / JCM 22182 / KY 12970) TaxID=764103 RepID=G7DZA3_MIXOS|nr:uncharacterized protein L969DRAFT_42281 [Mixia osmundae IAM 14324]KEI42621.1 hypothetical protein L969DRAFT_42281 [Mixia osmundae IAM 14324]GAA95913.1 hypothetical protein E5Q_02571 [Mixia osmundae IAM 14324]